MRDIITVDWYNLKTGFVGSDQISDYGIQQACDEIRLKYYYEVQIIGVTRDFESLLDYLISG